MPFRSVADVRRVVNRGESDMLNNLRNIDASRQYVDAIDISHEAQPFGL